MELSSAPRESRAEQLLCSKRKQSRAEESAWLPERSRAGGGEQSRGPRLVPREKLSRGGEQSRGPRAGAARQSRGPRLVPRVKQSRGGFNQRAAPGVGRGSRWQPGEVRRPPEAAASRSGHTRTCGRPTAEAGARVAAPDTTTHAAHQTV
ncbi:unnamed protein product [Miscanthus lutarioriparius]|uniref:Uncharacterized protein n=1 Tax=Miscanthus lutarioriparius TaxID=422564 RepID=A0A811QBW0_9POAL|nr:unnamed protein product [Miscanthus lutarioriparius]